MMNFNHRAAAATAYTTGADFCRIFAEDMDTLYLLAYLLTADPEKAERCFVAGIGDCVEGNAVFKEWARSWARRTIVRNAIQMVNPAQNGGAGNVLEFPAGILATGKLKLAPELDAIVRLSPLERFAFVMATLEGFSYQDCSLLLGCSRQVVMNARQRALQRLEQSSPLAAMHEDETFSNTAMLSR